MPARSTTITPDLQRAMIRDATAATLTTPRAVFFWTLAVAAFLCGLLLVVGRVGGDSPVLLIAPVLFAVVLMRSSRRSTRRAVTAALPVGSTVTAAVHDRVLHVENPSGVHDVDLRTYRGVRTRRSVVALQLRSSAILTVLPRDAFDDAGLASLQAGVSTAATTP